MRGEDRRAVQPGWPLIERRAATKALRAGLAERPVRLQLIEGDAGTGKSSLAAAIAQATGAEVLRVVALAESMSTPLAAFSPVVAASGSDGLSTPDAIAEALGRRAARGLLLVDDLPRLDQASAEVVARLVRRVGMRVLATARAGERCPAPIIELEDEGLLRRHRLSGLTAKQVARVLEARFRVPAGDEDVRRLFAETAGNPLHMRVLVEEAIEAGHVLHRGDRVEFARPRSAGRLRAVLTARVATLSSPARHLLAVIAIAEPVEADALLVPHGRGAALGELARRGMVTPDATTSRLRIAHPLIGEVLPQADRAAAIDEALRLLRGDGEPARRFRAVHLELGAGRHTTAEELVWAARYASAGTDERSAAEMADAAVRQPAAREVAFTARVVAGRAHSRMGRLDAADALFAAAAPLARTAAERATLASAHGEHLAFARRDPEAAIAAAERAREELTGQEAVGLDADLWRWRVLTQRPGTQPETRHAIAATVAACMRAEPDAALTAAQPLLATAPLDPLAATAAIPLGLQRVVALRSAGRGAEAIAFLESARVAAGEEAGFHSLMLAGLRAQLGAVAAAADDADLAVAQLQRWDGGELLSLALALRATVAALCGDDAAARARLAELRTREVSGGAVLQRAECEAILRFRDGEREAAIRTILEVVEDAIRSEYRYLGALTLATAVRFGEFERSSDVAQRLCADLAEPSEVCLSVRDLAGALHERHAAAALTAAERMAAVGLVAAAVDAATLAQRLPGDDATRRRLRARAAGWSYGMDSAPFQSREAPALTPRELEVATAAAARMRSREIAERVGLSVRTVENHLAAVYRKLGVASRDDLRRALLDLGLAGPGAPRVSSAS